MFVVIHQYPSLINLKGVRSDLNKLKEWSNYMPEGFKEAEKDEKKKFKLVEAYLEGLYERKINDHEIIEILQKINNKIRKTVKRKNKFIPFSLFREHFEKWIIRNKREKQRQRELQKQRQRKQRQIKYVRHRNPNQPPLCKLLLE